MWKIQLADAVWYNNRIWYINNMVIPGKAQLIGLHNDHDGWVSLSELKKVRLFKNYWQTFKFRVKFYEGYWLDIWCRTGTKKWRHCNIWN